MAANYALNSTPRTGRTPSNTMCEIAEKTILRLLVVTKLTLVSFLGDNRSARFSLCRRPPRIKNSTLWRVCHYLHFNFFGEIVKLNTNFEYKTQKASRRTVTTFARLFVWFSD